MQPSDNENAVLFQPKRNVQMSTNERYASSNYWENHKFLNNCEFKEVSTTGILKNE